MAGFLLLIAFALFFPWLVGSGVRRSEATRRVREENAKESEAKARVATNETGPGPTGSVGRALTGIKQFFEDVVRGVDEMERSVERARALDAALAASRAAIETERALITVALADAEWKTQFDSARDEDNVPLNPHARWSAQWERDKRVREAQEARETLDRLRTNGQSPGSLTVPTLTAPPAHPDAEINESIQHLYRHLLRRRGEYFEEVRQRMQDDPRLPDLVRSYLERMGGRACWDALSQSSPRRGASGASRQARLGAHSKPAK